MGDSAASSADLPTFAEQKQDDFPVSESQPSSAAADLIDAGGGGGAEATANATAGGEANAQSESVAAAPPLPAWTGGVVSKYRPVSIATGISLATVFGLYASGKLDKEKIDCSNKFLPTVARDFTHVDLMHLVFNLIALFYVSRLEAQFGSVPFLALMGIIVLICALGTMAVTKLLGVKCAIGFSGVLLALMAFGLTSGTQTQNWWLPLIYLIAVSVMPVPGQNISVSGHLIGIATGALLGLGFRATGLYKRKPVEFVAAATSSSTTT